MERRWAIWPRGTPRWPPQTRHATSWSRGLIRGVRKQVEELVAAIAAERGGAAAAADEAARDRRLVDRLTDIRSARADDRQGDATDIAYGEAFREADIDVDALSSEEAGRRIKARPAEIATPWP